jgi:hypothetical protein
MSKPICKIDDCLMESRYKDMCKKHYNQDYHLKNRKSITKRMRENYYQHQDERIEYSKKWRTENLEIALEKNRQYRADNADKISKNRNSIKNKRYMKKYSQKYSKTERGLGLRRATVARRRARKLQATPTWSDKSKIYNIYKNTPKGFHVDHIVPLKGKNVCGLHVSWNLQYLTPAENRRKSNRFNNVAN